MKLYIHQHKATILAGILFFSLACLIAIADRAPLHSEKPVPGTGMRENFQQYYDGMINQTQPGPYVYRVLIPYAIKFVKAVFTALDIIFIDLVFKIIILTAYQLLFFLFLVRFFPSREAVYGVLWLDLLLAYSLSTVYGPSIGETMDLFNAAIFCVALLALFHELYGIFYLILFIGMMNRETPLFLIPLPAVVGLYSAQSVRRSAIAFLAAIVPYVAIRMAISGDSPVWFTAEAIGRNIPFLSPERTMNALVANLHLILLLGPLVILTLYKFKEHPAFLQRIVVIVPIFIIVHYIVASIIEARLWMPVFILLIPPAMNTLRLIFSNDVVKRFT
ncbi:MAG: hypothetical protein EPO24_07085 [Bacteroidetes bacterium]|nr:MAG: hypothetical protein EPO24_07085 [Bacteroidota bacterium]